MLCCFRCKGFTWAGSKHCHVTLLLYPGLGLAHHSRGGGITFMLIQFALYILFRFDRRLDDLNNEIAQHMIVSELKENVNVKQGLLVIAKHPFDDK